MNDIVYMLYHIRDLDPEGTQDVKLIGVYTSEQRCKNAMDRVKNMPGFLDYPDGFEIDEAILDRDNWVDGFHVLTRE